MKIINLSQIMSL